MFVRNAWYVAAWGDELGQTPLSRRLLGDPIVFYRTKAGDVVALDDRCCHRHAPLSKGRVVEDAIRCGYHGLTFDSAGRCIAIPGQQLVPPGASVRCYPVTERWGWVWVWMGDPTRIDDLAIPDFHLLDDPGWRSAGERLQIKCHYQLVIDNLLDLSHLSYLHESTIGTAAVAETPVTTERDGDKVRVTRWMIDVEPPPTFVKAGGFETNIDRW